MEKFTTVVKKIKEIPVVKEILRSKEEAQKEAQAIAAAGRLSIDFRNVEKGPFGVYARIFVYSPGNNTQKWWVDIRPVHFPGHDTKVFNFEHVRFIKFRYNEQGITPYNKYATNPSTYLEIEEIE